MMKRWAFFTALLLLPLAAPAGQSHGGYTLIVAPARYSVMQVAFDVINRESSVLVSYQGEASAAEPLIHAWNGQEWVRVSLSDYREVNFLQQTPARTVLIGDDQTLPASLVEASSWSPEIVRIGALDTASLVNEFGKIFSFQSKDWQWFAGRYNLDLHDENVALRNASWYDQPGPLKKKPAKPAAAAPAQVEDQIAPAPMEHAEPVQAEEEVAPVAEPSASAMPDADKHGPQ